MCNQICKKGQQLRNLLARHSHHCTNISLIAYSQMKLCFFKVVILNGVTGLKMSWMTQVTFTFWWVKRFSFVNFSNLDVSWIFVFIRIWHWHLVRKWTFGLVNTLNHHWWCETSLLPQAVLKHVAPRDFVLKKSVD